MQYTLYAYAQGLNTQPCPAVNNARTCILSYPAKAIMFVNWQYLFFPLFFLLWTHIKVKEKNACFSLVSLKGGNRKRKADETNVKRNRMRQAEESKRGQRGEVWEFEMSKRQGGEKEPEPGCRGKWNQFEKRRSNWFLNRIVSWMPNTPFYSASAAE